jgi:UDP-glucose 4-epimerase
VLVASSTKAEQLLGWTRQYATIDEIVATAWKFHQNNPDGLRK